jgi:ABC-type amino acid transport system permease subunit
MAVRLGAYVEVFRNIPLIAQMFLWFFVARAAAGARRLIK